jgi:hypothetical protein
VPPSGNKQLVGRFMKRDFLLSMRITWAFVGKSFATNLAACREAFFSPELPEADLKRCAAREAGGGWRRRGALKAAGPDGARQEACLVSLAALCPSQAPAKHTNNPVTPLSNPRYQAELAAGSPVRLLDLQDMTRQVPLPPPPPGSAPPRFVLGGDIDNVGWGRGLARGLGSLQPLPRSTVC